MDFQKTFLRPLQEFIARNKSMDDLTRQLEKSGQEVAARIERAPDTSKNRAQANHIIGIERWGQRRLRVLLGEPPVSDEYDGYRVAEESLPAMRAAFQATRAETLAIVRQLRAAAVAPTAPVAHNSLGQLSMRAWLDYLDNHAKRETIALR